MPRNIDAALVERGALPDVVGPFVQTVARYAQAKNVAVGDLIAAHVVSLRGVVQAGVPVNEWSAVLRACATALQRDAGEFVDPVRERLIVP